VFFFLLLFNSHLYLPFLTGYAWGLICLNEQIFIDTPKEITRERLARRHLEAGIAKTMAEAEKRAEGSDARNADDILRWRGKVDIVVNGSDFTTTGFEKK